MQIVLTDKAKGFTILEVIVVIAIIGIVTAVVIAGFNQSSNTLAVSVDILKAHIRYAQSRAMNSVAGWGVKGADDGKSYWLFKNGDPSNHIIRAPGEDENSIDLDKKDLSLSSFVVSFDNRGIPCSDTFGSSPLTSNLSITITSNNGGSFVVIITKNTGFIQ